MQEALSRMKKSFIKTDAIEEKVESFRQEIISNIEEFLNAWQLLTSGVEKEKLVDLVERNSEAVVDENVTGNEIFWLPWEVELNGDASRTRTSLYLKAGNNAIYVGQAVFPLVDVTREDGEEEYVIDLRQCNIYDALEIMHAVKRTFKEFPEKVLQSEIKSCVDKVQKRKKNLMP